MTGIDLKLCDIQGRLFVLAGNNGYESASFIEAFMSSAVADSLDERYNRMQGAEEEYLPEEIAAEKALKKGGRVFSEEALFWTGYLYRYRHILTGESGRKIVKQAYETYEQKRNSGNGHGNSGDGHKRIREVHYERKH